jgi:hypothetical protein
MLPADFKIDAELNLEKPLFRIPPPPQTTSTDQYADVMHLNLIYQDAIKYFLEKQNEKVNETFAD